MQTRTSKIGDFIPSCFTFGEKGKVSLEQKCFYSADTRFLSWSNRWKFSTGSRDMNVNSEGGASIWVWKNNSFEGNFVIEEWKSLLPDGIKEISSILLLSFLPRELLVFSAGNTGIQLRGNRGKSAKSNTFRKWVMSGAKSVKTNFPRQSR